MNIKAQQLEIFSLITDSLSPVSVKSVPQQLKLTWEDNWLSGYLQHHLGPPRYTQ